MTNLDEPILGEPGLGEPELGEQEYARHNGHADLLRESVDGLTGE